MTEFQKQVCEKIRTGLNGQCSTTRLAERLKTSRLAISSACRSLEKQGVVGYFRDGRDQWAAQVWFLKGVR